MAASETHGGTKKKLKGLENGHGHAWA
ncbi:BnaC07g33040D [Brassica napus]|uniref:BnaC07g33040D protein n=1 Tax=Brassica napus TaxID=3708 RepID=A0A078F9J9_BRANA|nr:BnaC07g33040D [Brassica napus]